MDRLRIGVVGAGFVAQVVHLPLLAKRADLFALAAIADPDPVSRGAAARFGVRRAYASHEQLIEAGGIDAVLVCSPDATHAPVTLDALAAGLHVLVEKPLTDANRVIAARDAAGTVVQVGCMKRFDPAYEALLDDLAATGPELLHIATLTHDPGLGAPFAPPGVRSAAPATAEQAFHGALVHDVNAVHGILDALGVATAARVIDAHARDDGSLAAGVVEVADGVRWTLAWAHLPAARTFHERIELVTSDGIRRLEFPAPYLLHAPTAYTAIRGRETTTFGSWDEAYERQLEHFHATITAGVPCRTPPETARVDHRLLSSLHDAAMAVTAA
jgi:predicted dehydrogenase